MPLEAEQQKAAAEAQERAEQEARERAAQQELQRQHDAAMADERLLTPA
jgi:hypothetical protein